MQSITKNSVSVLMGHGFIYSKAFRSLQRNDMQKRPKLALIATHSHKQSKEVEF
jgi:hypothetical protein